jgi:hypothetical protein
VLLSNESRELAASPSLPKLTSMLLAKYEEEEK